MHCTGVAWLFLLYFVLIVAIIIIASDHANACSEGKMGGGGGGGKKEKHGKMEKFGKKDKFGKKKVKSSYGHWAGSRQDYDDTPYVSRGRLPKARYIEVPVYVVPQPQPYLPNELIAISSGYPYEPAYRQAARKQEAASYEPMAYHQRNEQTERPSFRREFGHALGNALTKAILSKSSKSN